MEIIRDHLHHWNEALPCIAIPVERLTLAKRRWRGVAADSREFGFDLEHPLAHRDIVFATDMACYQIAQEPEATLEIRLTTLDQAAQLGWKVGNLHFQIAVTQDAILAPDDSAIRQMLTREDIPYRPTKAVFQPLGTSHSHGQHHH